MVDITANAYVLYGFLAFLGLGQDCPLRRLDPPVHGRGPAGGRNQGHSR